ncbi:hypothetical protein Q6280_27930, partial [Klebsiella pneumoniae]|uniref:hypothetical protein n=1 Tax=Klebsiella pneumoniae TaxID=573 RepID=UPI002731DDBF
DETNPGMRSYSKFESGGGPWTFSGYQDFMMRAIVSGPGGPWPTLANNQYVEAKRPHRESLSNSPPRHIRGAYVQQATYAPYLTT